MNPCNLKIDFLKETSSKTYFPFPSQHVYMPFLRIALGCPSNEHGMWREAIWTPGCTPHVLYSSDPSIDANKHKHPGGMQQPPLRPEGKALVHSPSQGQREGATISRAL